MHEALEGRDEMAADEGFRNQHCDSKQLTITAEFLTITQYYPIKLTVQAGAKGHLQSCFSKLNSVPTEKHEGKKVKKGEKRENIEAN